MTEQEQVLEALQGLTAFCISGKRYVRQNPYTIPEIQAALAAIKAATEFQGLTVDSNDAYMAEYRIRALAVRS